MRKILSLERDGRDLAKMSRDWILKKNGSWDMSKGIWATFKREHYGQGRETYVDNEVKWSLTRGQRYQSLNNYLKRWTFLTWKRILKTSGCALKLVKQRSIDH